VPISVNSPLFTHWKAAVILWTCIYWYSEGATGQFANSDDPYRDDPGLALVRILYPLHSGRIIGPVGAGIVFLLGFATAEMCVTGIYVWWCKRRTRRAIKA
jgi:uncharacterized iron-regulated membrane protein